MAESTINDNLRVTLPQDEVVRAGSPAQLLTSSVLSYAILIGGIATIVVALYMVVMSYSSLPFWDGWIQVQVAANGESPISPRWLWKQHNEHRLVLPKLFLAADLRLFGARQIFLLSSIFAIQLLHLGLLSWSMRVLGGWRGALWRTGSGLAAFCLFCPSQWENIVWGFQVCFVLPQLLATVSFITLLLYWKSQESRPGQTKLLVGTILAALGASYSLANGSLLWPILFAAALYLRLKRSAVLSIGITGLLSTGLYFYHYIRPPEHANPIASLLTPLKLLQYYGEYFASPWFHWSYNRAERLIFVSVVLVLVLLAPALTHLRDFRAFVVQLVLMIVFCLGTGLITATGRLNFGADQSFSPRYQTIALLFWCCIGLLWLGAAFFARSRLPFAFPVAQLCLLAILVRGAVIANNPITAARALGFKQKVASASLLNGIYAPGPISLTSPQMDIVQKSVPYMRTYKLSVFSSGDDFVLGKPLPSVFRVTSPEKCVGAADRVVPLYPDSTQGMAIFGWAWDLEHHALPSSIVITTGGIISGLGAVGGWRGDVPAAHPAVSSKYSGFIVVAPNSPPPPGVEEKIYAVLQGNPPTACYLPAE